MPIAIEWNQIATKERLNLLVARISARVFLGEELCRNAAWLKLAVGHIRQGFIAALCLRMFPAFARPVIHWILPPCRQLRAQVQMARDLIRPVIERRRRDRAKQIAAGETPKVYNDGIVSVS